MTMKAAVQCNGRWVGCKSKRHRRTKPCGPPEFTSYRSSELSTAMIGLEKSELVRGMQPGPPLCKSVAQLNSIPTSYKKQGRSWRSREKNAKC